MLKRIEFTLNLDDPTDAALYEELTLPLRHRRAGALIRQALATFLFDAERPSPKPRRSARPEREGGRATGEEDPHQADDDTSERILDRTATLFGFR